MWYNKYVGLPYQDCGRTTAGIDCWGLACLIYREHFDIELPTLDGGYISSNDLAVKNLVLTTKESWILTSEPKPGDICVFNILGEPTHVGVYIGNQKFLHARAGQDSVIESLNSVAWNRRLEGIYQYDPGKIQLTGAPHPLQTQNIITDWAAAGTSILELTQYICEKYNVSARLLDRIVILVDGVPVDKECWQTTRLLPNQTVAYRVMAAGGSTGRLLMTLAVVIAVITFQPEIGALANTLAGSGASAGTIAAYSASISMGLNMAGMALINAIAPITKPKDVQQGKNELNLFNGSSNQINRFGAIPVVLGKVRMTAVHGATPYIESLQDTSIINMALVWGFGPLSINDVQVGLTPIERFYTVDLQGKKDQALPVIIHGYAEEDTTSFDQLYGQDVTQQVVNIDLVNTPSDNPYVGGVVSQYGPWKEVSLTDQCTRIQLAFNFPQGLRNVKPSNGQVEGATAEIELQYKVSGSSSWTDIAPYTNTTNLSNANSLGVSGWQCVLIPPKSLDVGYRDAYEQWIPNILETYQWYTITLQANGGLALFAGTPTDSVNSEPSASLLQQYSGTQLNQISTTTQDYSANYTRLPQIPSNHIAIYNVCMRSEPQATGVGGTSNYYTHEDMRSSYGTASGLNLFRTDQTNGNLVITISTGNIVNSGTEYLTGTETEKFSTKNFTSSTYTITDPTTQSSWCNFLNDYGRWIQQSSLTTTYTAQQVQPGKTYTIATVGTTDFTSIGANNNIIGTIFVATSVGIGTGTVYMNTFEITQAWTSAEAGTYKLYFSADNTAKLYIDNELIMSLSDENSYTTAFTNTVQIEAGTRQVKIVGINTDINTPAAVAAKFTITRDGESNSSPTSSTILRFGVSGAFYKYADAFNDTYNINNLALNYYTIRVRRNNRSWGGQETFNPDGSSSGGFYAYDKSILYTVTGYNNNKPITNPPGCYLAKTAIRLQSTGKVNGTVDGINALVQTRGWDVAYSTSGTKTWIENEPINNPASLFRYVLTHPANMYAVTVADIDLDQLIVWHEFCKNYSFTYNSVITNTQSVMDTLREICAAGLASPTMINGKWSVVIDKLRDNVTQYFTPHNSWGFESTKSLPKIPDAFRVTINNEDKAYQPDEFFVYQEGLDGTTAKIYEQLTLPGVTNKAQAIYLAKWHFAQLKLRPETYKLNVDFEYLVCTRGDLVRVSHDIPQWGTGSGRIVSVSYTTSETTIVLSEQLYLDSTKTYCIRIRRNGQTFYNLSAKTLKTGSYTTGYTNTVIISQNLTTAGIDADNLYMIGEKISGTEKDSQQLIVLSIEPTSNTSAVLTLTDYSPTIYAGNFENLVYDPLITGSNNDVIVNSITQSPTIQDVTSDSAIAQLTSPGVYTNIVRISISHPGDLTQIAEKIEIQYTGDQDDMNTDTIGSSIIVDKSAGGGIEIQGLVAGNGYKFRARYLNNLGTIRGPWSAPPFNAVVVGKVTNNLVPSAITVELDDYYLVIIPSDSTVINDDNFKTFEYRVYKNSGSTTQDFWDLGTSLSTIKFIQSRGVGRIDLRTFDQPKISEAGVQYRVACKAVDNNNNYSVLSTLNYFILKTIVEEDPED
jgi:hypothetical protein